MSHNWNEELEESLMLRPLSRKAKNRLGKLADLLEKDAKNKRGLKFDMRTFCDAEVEEPGLNCHTTACALGLAALSGAFKRMGLGYTIQSHVILTDFGKEFNSTIGFTFKGKSDHPYEVGAHTFDIDHVQSRLLFGGALVSRSGAVAEREMVALLRRIIE